MTATYDVIVAGRGMMGSAAARHLALAGASTALIGPTEPAGRTTHQGIFASHYDEGRITRALDPDPLWSHLAVQSIRRYPEIARASGIDFFTPCGAILAGPAPGPETGYVQRVRETGHQAGIQFETLTGPALSARFPYLDFPASTLACFEPAGAGYISPRLLVAAECKAAAALGADIIPQEVTAARETGAHVTVTCADGSQFTCGKLILATGAYAKASPLLPDPPDLRVYARTVALLELDDAEAARLATMPSLILEPAPPLPHIYMLPPIRYPDGRIYLKIGGDPEDTELPSHDDIGTWFRGPGDLQARNQLSTALTTLLPDLRHRPVTSVPCVTTYTSTGYPLIRYETARIISLTGGNGAAAKSCDELGRLATCLTLTTNPGPLPGHEDPWAPFAG